MPFLVKAIEKDVLSALVRVMLLSAGCESPKVYSMEIADGDVVRDFALAIGIKVKIIKNNQTSLKLNFPKFCVFKGCRVILIKLGIIIIFGHYV